MSNEEKKLAFIESRALGRSYDAIASDLHVSKSTLTNWGKELSAEIVQAKDIEREALIESFGLHKEGRIRQIGGILQRLEVELEARDLSKVSTAKLADLVLKYHATLKDEGLEIYDTKIGPKVNAEVILDQFRQLLENLSNGRISRTEANKTALILSGFLRAYETTALEQKLDTIKAVVEGR